MVDKGAIMLICMVLLLQRVLLSAVLSSRTPSPFSLLCFMFLFFLSWDGVILFFFSFFLSFSFPLTELFFFCRDRDTELN